MRRFAWMGLMALAGLSSVSCSDSVLQDKEVFIAELNTSEEVPARPTGANGAVQIVVDGNQISYSIEVDDINSITFSHIHTAAPGVNGPVRLFLYPPRQGDPAPLVTATDKTVLVEATVDSSLVSGISYEELLAAMRSGNAYVNVHTSQFPSGEMRGQIRTQNID